MLLLLVGQKEGAKRPVFFTFIRVGRARRARATTRAARPEPYFIRASGASPGVWGAAPIASGKLPVPNRHYFGSQGLRPVQLAYIGRSPSGTRVGAGLIYYP